MSENERGKIVEYLSLCSDPELREILFNVFQTRRPNPEEDAYNKNCFFLGTASRLLESDEGEPEHWGDWEIQAVAYINREMYGEDELGKDEVGIDWGFCQGGTCSTCGIAVRSNLKCGICPVCSSEVYMG